MEQGKEGRGERTEHVKLVGLDLKEVDGLDRHFLPGLPVVHIDSIRECRYCHWLKRRYVLFPDFDPPQ